jgi:hypothetical protein
VDTLAGVLTGLWPGAAARGGGIPAATSSHLDEVLWGNADNCERLRAMFKSHSRRVRGARSPAMRPKPVSLTPCTLTKSAVSCAPRPTAPVSAAIGGWHVTR